MRGHDQSSRRGPSRAWLGLILLATAGASARPARGQEAPAAGPPADHAREPVDLAAQRVRVWRQGDDQWVVLSGGASVLQGVEGLRSREAVVRVRPTTTDAGTSYRLDVYAEVVRTREGEVPAGAVRAALRTEAEVRLQATEPGGTTRLDGPPRGLGVLVRSGMAGPPRGPRAHIAARPIPGPAVVPTSATVAAAPAPGASGPVEPTKGEAPPVVALPEPEPAREPAPPVVLPTAAEAPAAAKADPEVNRAQFGPGPMEGADDPTTVVEGDLPGPVESAPDVAAPARPPTELAPLPAPGSETTDAPPLEAPAPAAEAPRAGPATPAEPLVPVLPGSQRITRIYPRNGGPLFQFQGLGVIAGRDTVVIRGGVNIVTESPQFGVIDISAESVIIWRTVDPRKPYAKFNVTGPNGERIEDARQPMEVYMEGDVVVRQDERKVAGNGDQKTYRARAAYYDLLNDRFIGLDAELDMFAPGLISPARVVSPRIEQYRPLTMGPNGRYAFGLSQIRADRTMSTGSRFPQPGYRFNSKSMDVYRVPTKQADPNTGKAPGDPAGKNPDDLTWQIDARQNVFWLGAVPVFYWPRIQAEAQDLEAPLRNFTFRTNNYFGQQVLTDFNGFRVFGLKRPKNIDVWNLDVDYLSARTKQFPALGSEIGWFGNDLINDLTDPYGRQKGRAPSWTNDYFGYFDVWGLKDSGRDILGSGPAIITNNIAAGNIGIQRGGGGPKGSVPAFETFRGRLSFRHMQRFLPDDDEHLYEDVRLQVEAGYYSDRYFLEEYYKRLFDVGMDQETLVYGLRQKDNWAYSIWGEVNPYPWQTETQWLPKLDYYRLGDSLVGNRLTYFQHSGVDYANTHTASEVNNPHIFAFLPYDPISNTSGTFSSGRAYTNHEVDLPLNFENVLRVVPYVQGQGVGWSDQINGQAVGRIWGAAGVRAEVMAWKAYPLAENELLNVHGLNHKINLEADYRDAWSNVRLNSVGVQDDLDDNTYESVRRYFALTNYAGGILPAQYDPRHLILRRTLSPVTGTTDVQGTIETLHLGVHQRLQTKRGPQGRRRVIDFMTLDFDTTYFPYAARDNFNKPFGQNMYNWQWFLGDRTSLISTGWFEFWNLGGQPIYKTNTSRHNDPFGLNVITTGIALNRPPRANIFVGYSVISTGPINTSALTTTVNYWMSPKYYGTYSTMYDFGNAILLAATFSLTRVGADYLTSVGLTVDPQRQSYMFAFQVSPRLSPGIKFGSGVGLNNFDSRYAPTQ